MGVNLVLDMNADYKVLLDKYRRELGDLEGKRAVCRSRIDDLCLKLGVAGDVTDAELEAKRVELDAKRAKYEARLDELVAELSKIDGNA